MFINILKKLNLLVLLLVLCSGVSLADDKFSAGLKAGIFTDYMFRGTNLYDGVSIQPTLSLGYDLGNAGSIGGSSWAHLSGEGGESATDKFTEVDHTLFYSYSMKDVATLSLGHIWYTYPGYDITDTKEFFASLALALPLNPVLSAYQDYDAFDLQYYELGLSHTLKVDSLGKGFNVTPFVTFAFASNSEKVYENDGLVHTTFGASFDAKLGDVSLVPSLYVTRESDSATDNEFWMGTTFGFSM